MSVECVSSGFRRQFCKNIGTILLKRLIGVSLVRFERYNTGNTALGSETPDWLGKHHRLSGQAGHVHMFVFVVWCTDCVLYERWAGSCF